MSGGRWRLRAARCPASCEESRARRARPGPQRLCSRPVPGSLAACASGAYPRTWRGLGQVRPLPLPGPRLGAGAFCPLCAASGPGRGPRAGVGAGWPGGLAVVFLGLPGGGREESPLPGSLWDRRTRPLPSSRAVFVPLPGPRRVCDLGKDGVEVSDHLPPRPQILNAFREAPESGALQN